MPDNLPTDQEVIALETAYWEAMKAKDGDTTARLSGEVSLVTGPQGVASIARDKMGEMTRSDDWTLSDYKMADIAVTTPVPGVAIIVYTVTQNVTLKGEPRRMRAADSSTWIKGPEGWACHAHSETLLDDKAA